MSLAIINLYGNLGRDAELRYTPEGRAILAFSIACSSYQGSGEQRQEHTLRASDHESTPFDGGNEFRSVLASASMRASATPGSNRVRT